MHKYEIVAHTADIALKLEASTPQEFFECALQGMNSIVKENFCPNSRARSCSNRISISSVDQTALLVDFLNEVLAMTHAKKTLFCTVDFQSLEDGKLEAEVSGERVDKFDEDVKAVTHHGAAIRINEKGNMEATVLFDI
ncbi:MAG TPA: archease [Armatimonadota bacterium]|jgi:SHS2 domain-containing protein